MGLQFVPTHHFVGLNQPSRPADDPVPLELVDVSGTTIPLASGSIVELHRVGPKYRQTVRARVEVRDGRYMLIPQLWNKEFLEATPLDPCQWLECEARLIARPMPTPPASAGPGSASLPSRHTAPCNDSGTARPGPPPAVGSLIDQIC